MMRTFQPEAFSQDFEDEQDTMREMAEEDSAKVEAFDRDVTAAFQMSMDDFRAQFTSDD